MLCPLSLLQGQEGMMFGRWCLENPMEAGARSPPASGFLVSLHGDTFTQITVTSPILKIGRDTLAS